MKYFFHTGNFSRLSYAELVSVLKAFLNIPFNVESIEPNVLLVETAADEKEMLQLFKRLGGFLRFGVVISDLDTFLQRFDQHKDIAFGISVANFLVLKKFDERSIKKLSKQLKDYFKEQGTKVRYVLPQKDYLNAAQVIKNDLVDKGFELFIAENNKQEMIYGSTLAVQDIEEFVKRDYGRPSVDVEMGMLPPKLARIMVNLTGLVSGKTIWDPFCGSGTVLMEALAGGYNVLGSDVDPNAIESSKKNLEWFIKNNEVYAEKYRVFDFDIVKQDYRIIGQLKHTLIDAVVCEPFMGVPQRKLLSPVTAEKLGEAYSELIRNLFEVVVKLKNRNIRIVLVVPSYKTTKGWIAPSVNRVLPSHWAISEEKQYKDLHWERTHSIIRRNILIIEHK